MLHIHELDSIASDYYFFDENCSYMLFLSSRGRHDRVSFPNGFIAG